MKSSSTAVTASSEKTAVKSASGSNTKNQLLKIVNLVDSDIEICNEWTAGGFDDEDEKEERDAAHLSPPKGNK
jgi:hypothetical protein